jgi:hypothetical protein
VGAAVTIALIGQVGRRFDVEPAAFSLSGTYSGAVHVSTPLQSVIGINTPIVMQTNWAFNQNITLIELYVNSTQRWASAGQSGTQVATLVNGDQFYIRCTRQAHRTGVFNLYNLTDSSKLLAQFNITLTP